MAVQIASLTKDIKPKVSYKKGPNGVFTKFKGTGIAPPAHHELELIQTVLAEARANKTGATADRSRMAKEGAVPEFGCVLEPGGCTASVAIPIYTC